MDWLPFISYAVISTFTPGPNNIMAMAGAARGGFQKTVRFCAGVATGFAGVLILSGYLNLVLSGFLPRFRIVMSILGAAYLLYLAAGMVWPRGGYHAQASKAAPSYWIGAALQFVNPKGIMYGMTVFGSFVDPEGHSPGFLVVIILFLALLALVSTICWALFGSVFQRLLAKYERPFNVGMALLLVYCALTILR
ncbi:MAG: LysE family transporter [Bacillota bacterium]